MENPRSPLLTWPYYYQGKSMEDLRQSLLYTTLELESTRLGAQEEIAKLQDLLNKTILERNQAQQKYNHLLLEKLLTPQPQNPSVVSSIEDETFLKRDNGGGVTLSSSDCEESIVSSPPQQLHSPESAFQLRKPLPEKGKLLQAVMNSGPILQTLLLAGPLPEWKHPPPPLERIDIPPVQIPAHFDQVFIHNNNNININHNNNCGVIANSHNNTSNRKRSFGGGGGGGGGGAGGGDSYCETSKYQRVLFP